MREFRLRKRVPEVWPPAEKQPSMDLRTIRLGKSSEGLPLLIPNNCWVVKKNLVALFLKPEGNSPGFQDRIGHSDRRQVDGILGRSGSGVEAFVGGEEGVAFAEILRPQV